MAGYNHFPEIIERLDEGLNKAVRKTALDMVASMQGYIRANNQIDTGFLLNSVYMTTFGESTYTRDLQRATRPSKAGKTSRRAGRILARGDDHLLDEVEMPDTQKTAYVAVGADYGADQNYGTRFMAARPFFEPAIEDVKPGFEMAVGKITERMKEIANR